MQSLTCENWKDHACQGTVIVDFAATWCGPCRILKPILEQISKESSAKVCVVDVDESPELSDQYAINALPTIIIFKDGVETKRIVGLSTKEKILESVN